MRRAVLPILSAVIMILAILPGCTVMEDPNKPPIAVFTAEPISVNVGEVIFFSANESKDKDGKIAKYSWNFGDGNVALGPCTEHLYRSGGDYSVDLVVTDDDGSVDRANTTVHINEWPVAEGMVEKDPVKVNEDVTFDGSSSTDKDGKIVDYLWDFGDEGTEKKGQMPTHRYTKVGTYNITLKVTDDNGAVATDTFKIDVVLRKYKVLWEEGTDLIKTVQGTTDENETTNKTVEITFTNLTALEFNMTWNDHIPIVGAANDDFTFEVESPDGDIKKMSTTTELISHLFKIDDVPDTIKYEAESSKAVEEFIASQYTSTKGDGKWKLRITCTEAGDISWIDDKRFEELDKGNEWDIEIIGYYYSASVVETG